jgi:Ca-activated chloride channel family protein
MATRVFAPLSIVLFLLVFGLVGQSRDARDVSAENPPGAQQIPQEAGTLRGVVVQPSGVTLPGVLVTVEGPERRTARTDVNGAFVFVGLPPGDYRVRFELAGFHAVTLAARVAAGADTPLRCTMIALAQREVLNRPMTEQSAKAQGALIRGIPSAPSLAAPAPGPIRYPWPGGENYRHIDENPFRRVSAEPLSTFSIDVDTASFANVRRFLNDGTLPPIDAVRIEELINYFRYAYPQPSGNSPFSVTTELAECPWNPKHRLALIGLQGRDMPEGKTPPRNLVFLIDVSGSMQSADKLPLVRNALRMLADVLDGRDRVSIVVYAGSSGLVLPPTRGNDRGRIHRAIAELEAGGSTNGAGGIVQAYQVAREQFVRDGINRVILATDGDFNVGVTSHGDLVRLIEEQRASGVFLSVLGVGTGNLKDATLEMLADKGNGNYAYLDSLQEARKVLVREAGGTLMTIARDVKLQVEFNPRHVAGYRLIGYENRLLQHEDFNDDKKDAGDIGAGHSVTALYEIVPAGVDVDSPPVDPLKYQQPASAAANAASDELLTVKLRYKEPSADASQLIAHALVNRVGAMSASLGFASAVAEVGLLLRASPHAPAASFATAIQRARTFRGPDDDGYRAEFIKLAELAASLKRLTDTTRP